VLHITYKGEWAEGSVVLGLRVCSVMGIFQITQLFMSTMLVQEFLSSCLRLINKCNGRGRFCIKLVHF
jgi:hypothetical protein